MPTLVTAYPLSSGTTSASTALTTASFTPAEGEVIVVKSMCAVTVTATPTGGGLTFTQHIRVATSPKPAVAIHTAVVGSSPSAMTVSVAWSGATRRAVVVERWSSAAVGSPPALNATTVGTSSAPSATVTTTAANSVVTWLDGDDNESTGTPTYRSSATAEQVVSANGTFSGWWAYQTAAVAGAQTIGMTAPAVQNWAMAGIEILDNSVVDQAGSDSFTLTDDAVMEVAAVPQDADDTATVDDSAVMDIVGQSLDADDTATVADDAVMDIVTQAFDATDEATVADAADMLIVGQSFTASDSMAVSDGASLAIVDSRAVLGTRALHVDYWLLDDDGNYVCPLPHFVGDSLSFIAGAPGAVNLEYAVAGLNFDKLRAAVTRRHDAFIAIRIDGTDETSYRARLNSRNEDRIAEQGTVTFSGNFMTRRLFEIVVGYQAGTEKGELVLASATAGNIMGIALAQAQARGTGTELSWTFTNTHDSNGLPWPTQTSPTIPPGTKLLALADKLREWGMAETEVTSGNEVRMYVPESVGINWALGDRPVVLRRGRDLTEATRQVSTEDSATDLLLAGADGLYQQLHDDTARAERGRQVEDYDSQGNLADSGSLLAYGDLELGRRSAGTESNTFALSFRPDQALPLRDLHVSDWVLSDTGEGLGDPDRIVQLTVERSSGSDHYSGSVVVNDLIAETDVLLKRQLDGLVGGAVIAGTSQSFPSVDDGKTPAAPTGLGAISLAYYDGAAPKATLRASWAAVTTNVDGSPLSDLSGYEVQYRYQAGQGLPTDWVTFAVTQSASTTAVSTDGLIQGQAVDVRVLAFDKFQHDSAWSSVYTVITATDADAPPTPSALDVKSQVGIFVAEWNKKGAAGEDMPGDFLHGEIHASPVSGFTVDRPVLPDGSLDTTASSTYRDRITGAGQIPILVGAYDETWFFRIVAVDRSGNASAASAQSAAVLERAGDGDISAVSVGKLTAGFMNAIMTVSGIIRTASTGARVELDSTGLRCYSAAGVVLFEFNIPTSLLTLVGKFSAGASPNASDRITLDPNYTGPGGFGLPTLLFHATGGTAGPGRANAFSAGTGLTGVGFNSGPSVVGATYQQSTLSLRPDQSRLGRTTQSGGGAPGGYVTTSDTRAEIGYTATGTDAPAIVQTDSTGQVFAGNNSGSVVVDPTGDLYLQSPTSGYIRHTIPVGNPGGFAMRAQFAGNGVRAYLRTDNSTLCFVDNQSGGGFMKLGDGSGPYKNFVIDHPVDEDRYLIHAAIEAPEALVMYRGTATVQDGEATVELPDYFEAATHVDGRTVQVTVMQPDEQPMMVMPEPPIPEPPFAWAPTPEPVPAPPVAYSASPTYPKDGRFRIVCPAPDGTRVSWLVHAVRSDGPPLDVEPLRSDVEVSGFGPYRTYTPKRPAA